MYLLHAGNRTKIVSCWKLSSGWHAICLHYSYNSGTTFQLIQSVAWVSLSLSAIAEPCCCNGHSCRQLWLSRLLALEARRGVCDASTAAQHLGTGYYTFTARCCGRAVHDMIMCLSVRPSVCLSVIRVLPKRLNLPSRKLDSLEIHSFPMPNVLMKLQWVSPNGDAK